MIKQYLEIKKRYPDAILFFRLGDFYEMFFDDAHIASKILGIVLTSRNKYEGAEVPMCGVPHHSADQYIRKLVQSGYKVAICEQLEDPSKARGIVKRDVVRVVTPGTLDDEEGDYSYIAALYKNKSEGCFGLVLYDACISKGKAALLSSERALLAELVKASPREFVVPRDMDVSFLRKHFSSPFITKVEDGSTEGFEGFPFEVRKAASLLSSYLKETFKNGRSDLHIALYNPKGFLFIDDVTEKNLELFRPLYGEDSRGTLFYHLLRTETPMGSRLLREAIKYPLIDVELIKKRHDAVDELVSKGDLSKIRSVLSGVRDIERIASRVEGGRATPRDLSILRDSLSFAIELEGVVEDFSSELLKFKVGRLKGLYLLLKKALSERPPISIKDGGVIRDGFDEELDELRFFLRDVEGVLKELEERERRRTGISSLKVGYNKVFGYYIEVTRPNLKKVPKDYVRKQTLVSSERFITAELKELEAKVLSSEEKILKREEELFSGLVEEVGRYTGEIKKLSESIALVDLLCAFAQIAIERSYIRPQVDSESRILIKDGRHPVVEILMGPGEFIPNDVYLDKGSSQVLIITGPNMAGKSTYVRQVALIVLLAQMGSFVPASSAKIGVVDRIFSRIGATDNISLGRSTFMVEMEETANILRNITPNSLVILDEIGRGTSTYDGLSIAWSVCEYLHDHPNRPFVLFATHYHELSDLEREKNRVKNLCVKVQERGSSIVFLRKVSPGRADKSYGISVARLAGLPGEVIERAYQLLKGFEGKGAPCKVVELPERSSIVEFIKGIDLLNTTPLEAINILAELCSMVKADKKAAGGS